MALPRLLGAALWLVATLASTAMIWTATSIVAADVTDRPPSVVAHRDVVSELQSGPPATPAPPTSTAPKLGSPTGPPADRGKASAGPSSTLPASSQSPQPGTANPSPAPVPAAPGPTLSIPAGPPVSQPPSPPTATYSTNGGVVSVACNGFFIELTSAIPANGYSVKVVSGGPANVDVHFLATGQDISVKVVCFGQPIRYYDQSPPKQAP
ncbi:MAG: hypothetical protein ACR2HY_08680 [Acidimicrobiales bacterium]